MRRVSKKKVKKPYAFPAPKLIPPPNVEDWKAYLKSVQRNLEAMGLPKS